MICFCGRETPQSLRDSSPFSEVHPKSWTQNFWSVIMYRHHDFKERLNVVSRLLRGEPLGPLCRSLHLDRPMVRQWYLRYKKYGEPGLLGTRPRHYSAKEKAEIVAEFTVKGLTLQEISLRHDLHRTTIQSWVRKVRNGCPLEGRRRGRPATGTMARPKRKEPQTELEKLQAENLRLRAENALLKKVKALVEEQKARARSNGSRPSTN